MKRMIYARKKDVNGRLDTIAITTRRVYRILEIVVQFTLLQMTKANSTAWKRFSLQGKKEKGGISKRVLQKTKGTKFSEKPTFLTP